MPNRITDIFCEYLNGYCSTNIWNEPQEEHRHNIKLILQETRPRISTWQRTGENVNLPDNTNQYFVYAIPQEFFGLAVGSTDWRSVSTLLMGDGTSEFPRTDIQLRVHDSTGKRLMSNMVFLRSSTISPNAILIAVDANMLKKISDVDKPENDLYIGVYKDSDTPNNVSIANFVVNRSNVNQIVNASEIPNTIKFVNGYAVRKITADTISQNDLVELITDENIVFSFSIDLANDDEAREYASQDGQNKYIIHIPKSLNPNNAVISHDTCDFYIYPRNKTNRNVKGRFFHRCQGSEAKSFIQLTHNDFGVPSSLVRMFAGYCNSDEVVIDCVVRRHAHNRTLVRDRNYIDFLYQLDDNQILDFLEGNTSFKIDFWKARTLEASNFIAIMKDTSSQRLQYTLDQYTEALGYINTASLLCQRIYRTTFPKTPNLTALTEIVVLPLVYQWKTCPVCGYANTILSDSCSECNTDISSTLNLSAIVTLNGKKLPYNQVSTKIRAALASEADNTIKMVVSISGLVQSDLREENDLVIEIVEVDEFESYLFEIPSDATNLSYFIRKGEYNFYRKTALSSPVVIPNGSLTDQYTELNPSQGITVENLGDISRVTLDTSFKGSTVMVQSKGGSYFQYRDISALLEADKSLVYIPQDAAQKTTYLDFTPTQSVPQIETTACDDIEVYKFNSSTGKYELVTATSGYFNVEDISLRRKRITFTNSNFNNEFKIFTFKLENVPVMGDRQFNIYLNGLHLVENVDFWKTVIDSKLPPIYTIHNISYLEPSNNYLEVYESDMRKVVSGSYFIASDYINSKRNPVLYYRKFTNAYIGGYQHGQLTWSHGRLSTDCEIYSRKSGSSHYAWKHIDDETSEESIVYTASFPPMEDDYTFSDFEGTIDGRVESFNRDDMYITSNFKVYYRSQNDDWYYLTNDTNRGALYEIKTVIPESVMSVLNADYLAQDLNRFQRIVDYFIRLTPDDPERYTMPYSHRIASTYLNAIVDDIVDGSLSIPANTDIEYILPYLTDYEPLKQFDLALAYKSEPILDINGNQTGRIKRTPVVDRKFVDIYPSYKQRLVPGTAMYQTLLSLVKYFTIGDSVVDTVGVDTTVDTNRR